MANGFFTDRAVATSPFRLGGTGPSAVSALIPIPYGQVRVCTGADIGTAVTPCPHLASVFDTNGNPLNVPAGGFGQITADVQGRFSFQALPSSYQVQVAPQGSNTPQENYPITVSNFALGTAPTLTGANAFTGVNTFASLNGTCVVDGVGNPTIQSCINQFPSGNGDIFIPAGTYTSTSGPIMLINQNGQSNMHIYGAGHATVLQCSPSVALAACVDIGTAAPTVNLLNGLIFREFVIKGNANVTHAMRLQGTHTTTIQDVDGRDVTGTALQWLFGVGNVINHWHTTPNDGIGAFTTTPSGCMELNDLGANFGFTTTSIFTPRCEGASGTAILLRNSSFNVIGAAQVSGNGTALDIEPDGSTQSIGNLIDGGLFENSSGADGVIDNGFNTIFTTCTLANLGAGKVHIKNTNSTLERVQIGSAGITIDSTAKNVHLSQVLMDPTKLTDNGFNTIYKNNFSPINQKQWFNPTLKQTIPNFAPADGLTGGGGYDPNDHPVQGAWNFTTSAQVISGTVLTTGKPWRAIFIGVWENNTDGGGLPQMPAILEVTSAANTLAVGTVTLTFTVNGSGQFQAVTGANAASFQGSIYVNPSPQTAAGITSAIFKGVTQSAVHIAQDVNLNTDAVIIRMNRDTTQGDFAGIGFSDASSPFTEFNAIRSVRDATQSSFDMQFLTTPFGGGLSQGMLLRQNGVGGAMQLLIGSLSTSAGNLLLAGATSGNSTLTAPTTGGVANTMPSTAGVLGVIVSSGTSTLTANAALGAVTSQAVITTAAVGAATTDAIEWAYASAPGAGDSLCVVDAYVTAGNVNFVRSNPTAAAQNVSALVINWRIVR